MLEISVRPAKDNEILQIDEEAATLPKGCYSFDGTDWEWSLLMGISPGDWVVTINDPEGILSTQRAGTFLLEMGDDSGVAKAI